MPLIFSQAISQKSILDVGCGTGRYLKYIADRYPNTQLSGLDITKDIVTMAGEAVPQASFQALDLESPQMKTFSEKNAGRFDLIYSIGVFQCLSAVKIPHVFKAMRTMLSVGGHFFLVFALKTKEKPSRIGYLRFMFAEIEEMLSAAGFKVSKISKVI